MRIQIIIACLKILVIITNIIILFLILSKMYDIENQNENTINYLYKMKSDILKSK